MVAVIERERVSTDALSPQEKMDRWEEALLSGEYEPTRGALRSPYGYCCLGVYLDAVCGVTWLKDMLPIRYSPSFGSAPKKDFLNDELASEIGLDKSVTIAEKSYITQRYDIPHSFDTRQEALARINDRTMDFGNVVKTLEELGWDKV